jgi:NADPH:quinone reductase-like Zn-dependent oxidoreductase
MRAAVIYENGGPDVLRYEEVPDPGCPEGFVVFDADAISVEGGDLLARAAGALPSASERSFPALYTWLDHAYHANITGPCEPVGRC